MLTKRLNTSHITDITRAGHFERASSEMIMTNFIEKIQKINELASQLLAQGKAKDSVEAQKMAAETYGATSEMSAFIKDADKTVKEFQDYGDRVRKNDMKQPRKTI